MTDDPKVQSARARFEAAFSALNSAGAQTFAASLRGEGMQDRMPCWGGLAEVFSTAFTTEAAMLEALGVLATDGDSRALLVFLHLTRTEKRVLEEMARIAPSLPLVVQRALVALAPDAVNEASAQGLASVARALLSSAHDRGREREQVERRIEELLALRCLAPDERDPREEYKWGVQHRRGFPL
jgi:hypothetical protein